jgi:hypothetical protein
LLTNGKVLIVGGLSVPRAELYDPATGTFSFTLDDPVVSHGSNSTATRLEDGSVLIVGGSTAQSIAEIYNPLTEQFDQVGSLNEVHTFHTATLLLDGRVLIAGGQDQNFLGGPVTHDVAELYDPGTRTFTVTDTLKVGRSQHAATLLPNGDVLIVGGLQTTSPGSGPCLKSAEVYDHLLKTFSMTTEDMTDVRCRAQASLLGIGQVLIVGGFFPVTAELFDPDPVAGGTFSSTGSMTTPHAFAPTTMLSGGQVLAISGVIASGPFAILTSSVELYDPASGTFTVSGSLSKARLNHTATLLLDGRVLVTGGFNNTIEGNLSSAELGDITTNSVTKTFEPGGVTSQNYRFDDGNQSFSVTFDKVLKPFDLTITAVDTQPSVVKPRLAVLSGSDCVPYATSGLCVVYEAEGLVERDGEMVVGLPLSGTDYVGDFDIYIGFLALGDAGIRGRTTDWSEFVVVKPGIAFAAALLHAPGAGTGGNFTDDITIEFFPEGVPEEGSFIGFLKPIRPDGSSVFKANKVVPLKFMLIDDMGNPIPDASAMITNIEWTSTNSAGTEAPESPGEANTDNIFRYDNIDNQYIYNLSTKGFATGTYAVTVTSDKFLPRKAVFKLR